MTHLQRLLPAVMAFSLLFSCSNPSIESLKPLASADEYLEWMNGYLPLPDKLSYSESYWKNNVEKTLEVREEMGWNIPEREFRHFVLPLRVNNETLDDFRTVYADTLCRRVKGMSLYDAALEVNHWCHEQATYHPSDARTSSPMATVHNGLGRCGEESVLAVAALRAVGIPARQVYTPRWAHTDDNHAWVEVWVDGKWYFMGGCEPAAKLNMAWFNAPVSRAMLLHTKVFGDYHGQEDVIDRNPIYTEINVIDGYVPTRRNLVKVLDADGNALEGAKVEFCIYNYAEFYTIATYQTDRKGQTSLLTGCGDILVRASQGERFGFAVASSDYTEVTLDHKFGEEFSTEFELVPPLENPIMTDATEEQIAANQKRFDAEDLIRNAHDHGNPAIDMLRTKDTDEAKLLLSLLSAKDLCDVRASVLDDVLDNTSSLDPYVLSPRVAYEHLVPYRAEILASDIADKLKTPSSVVDWVRSNIAVDDLHNPQGLSISPIHVFRSRQSDSASRNLFSVALFRTLGIAARIDEVTGKLQYRDGDDWVDVIFDSETLSESAPHGYLSLTYTAIPAVRNPKYYRHFTLAKITDGKTVSLEYGTDADDTPLSSFGDSIALDAGYYSLVSGSRLADGSVLVHLEYFPVPENTTVTKPLVLRESSEKLSVLGSMDADMFLKDSGRGYYLLGVLGEKDEPSVHARLELESLASELNAWGRPVILVTDRMPAGLDCAVQGDYDSSAVAQMLVNGCDASFVSLPVIAMCDSFGRIVYLTQGYNTSLAENLRKVVANISTK